MNDVLAQAKSFYGGLSGRQRGGLIAAGLASLLSIGGVIWWSSQESYAPIYASSDLQDVKSAAAALDEAGIPYRLSEDGSRLEAPWGVAGEARVAVAAIGPQTGLEILNGIGLGESPDQKKWKRAYALQHDLEMSIASIDGVDACRVHIVQPDHVRFFDRQTKASASVMVQLRPGYKLDESKVQGIVALVSGAVHGIQMEDIALVDSKGVLLHPMAAGAEGMASTANLTELQSTREAEYRARILTLLAPILGTPQAVSVAVAVDLSQSTIERRKNLIDPDSQVVISENLNEQQSSSGGTARGVPGAESNLPEQAGGGAEGTKTQTLQEQKNYEFSKTEEVEIIPAGEVQRVQASVMVDAKAIEAVVANGTTTAEQLQRAVTEAVKMAVGFDAERKDAIEVSFVPFVQPEEVAASTTDVALQVREYLPSAAAILGVLLFFLFFVRPLVKSVTQPAKVAAIEAAAPEAEPTPEEAKSIEGVELVGRMSGLIDNLEPIDSRDLNRLAELHEEPAAQVLKRWLKAS